MAVYWFIFCIPLFGHIFQSKINLYSTKLLWCFSVLVCIAVVGLRYDVGCDWEDYGEIYQVIRMQNPVFSPERYIDYKSPSVIRSLGPGYLGINWVAARLDLGLVFVNLICAALMLYGLSYFCRRLSYPWLAWLFSVPYLITVVGMGYTRQAVAIGFFFWALAFLENRNTKFFLTLIVCGATFHVYLLLFLPLAIVHKLTTFRQRHFILTTVFFVTLLLISIPFLSESIIRYSNTSTFYSSGAPIRALMTAIPAALLLIFHKELALSSNNSAIWIILSFAALLFLTVVWSLTTLIDRMGLYLIPIQIFSWSFLLSLSRAKPYHNWLIGSLVGYYALVLFVWLNYADNSYCWTNYRNLLFL